MCKFKKKFFWKLQKEKIKYERPINISPLNSRYEKSKTCWHAVKINQLIDLTVQTIIFNTLELLLETMGVFDEKAGFGI